MKKINTDIIGIIILITGLGLLFGGLIYFSFSVNPAFGCLITGCVCVILSIAILTYPK